jgi:hypothetical protein
MLDCYLNAIGLAAPGLPGWRASASVLQGLTAYEPAPLDKYKPELLPPNERRRATELVRMAFRVCEELMSSSAIPMAECASIFASSGGDYPIIDQICRSLCDSERLVSPTQFHNSVHNSAAGYWSIATGSRQPSTSLSAYDDSFAVGLLEAMCLCQQEQLPTLLAVYDIQPPYPLGGKRLIPVEFGVALLLTPNASEHSLARLQLSPTNTSATSTPAQPALEALRLANPAARALPLLELVAQGKTGTLVFECANQQALQLTVQTLRAQAC